VTERVVVVRGAKVAVLDSGGAREPDAPVLLALHGYPDTGRIFVRLAAALSTGRARAAIRVVAPDWPGQGGSEPVASTFGPTARAAWLRDLLDALGIERCVVYGHDMGAAPALVLARDHGVGVRAVVVSNALLSNDAKSSLAIRTMRASQAYRVILPRLGRWVFARCLATFLEERLDAELETELRRRFLTPRALRTVVRACHAYDGELPGLLQTLAGLEIPTLAAWGKSERHFSLEHAQALERIVPQTEVRSIPGAHWMVHERAEDVARLIVSVVERLDSSAS
jgi:2-hydroxymuconate-semialdehyde hydrolase